SMGGIRGGMRGGKGAEHGVDRLRTFWDEITEPTSLWPASNGPFAAWQQRASAVASLLFGQPGFFAPRRPQDLFAPGKYLSYYDTAALRGTLERLVDFDRINAPPTPRLSVAAVHGASRHLAHFDNRPGQIRPRHTTATGRRPAG